MTVRILVVDDALVEQRLVGRLLEKQLAEVKVSYASNGRQALESIASEMPDLIVSDLRMPEMNGLELVENIKSKGYSVPVILMTSYGNEQIAVQALLSGAASYVPKLLLDKHLIETVNSVLAMSKSQFNRQRVLGSLDTVETRFILENDTSLIAPLIAYVQEQSAMMRLFDDLQLTRIGIALHESLTNAIHHGNLELDSELRQSDESIYYGLANERKQQQPYSRRRVRVVATLSSQKACFVIQDDGPGFSVKATRDPTDEINMDRIGGRGLLLIRSFMDDVSHNEQGNQITMVKKVSQRPCKPR